MFTDMFKTKKSEPAGGDTRPVIVIDDNDDDQFLLGRQIEQMFEGTPVKSFRNGAAFMDYMQDTMAMGEPAPKLILLDLHMPEMNGYSTLQMLRSYSGCANVPVIAISGTKDPDAMDKAFESGANDFMPKPSSKEDWAILEQCIRSHM